MRSGDGEVGGSGRGRRELAEMFVVLGVFLWGARKSSVELYTSISASESAHKSSASVHVFLEK